MANSRKTKPSSDHKILRRNAANWQARHPSKTMWKLSPPIPGIPIHSDLYVARVGDDGWGVFESRKAALNPGLSMGHVFYYSGTDMHRFVMKYSDVYTFHQIDKLPSTKKNSRRR